MNIAFAIEDVKKSGPRVSGETVQRRFGGFHTFQPLITFLGGDGFVLVLSGNGFLVGGPAPMALMEQTANHAIGLGSDGGVKVKSQSVGVIEFAQSLGVPQGRVVGRGRILNGQDGGQAATGIDGGIDQGLEKMLDVESWVFEKAIQPFGLGAGGTGLGKRIQGFTGEGVQNETEARVEAFVGQVGLRGDLGGPQFNGVGLGEKGSDHP